MQVIKRHVASTGAERRIGFTLAEILIALALIAVLAAVLLPAVAGQILKGDAGRVVQDFQAVRAGAESFLADVHRYPGRFADLSAPISTVKTDINGNVYPSGLVARWAGPYVTKDTLPGAIVATGFGGNLANTFKKDTMPTGVVYLAIVALGIAGPDFDKIDLQVDGVVDRTAGNLRWKTGGGDSTIYRAIPIQ